MKQCLKCKQIKEDPDFHKNRRNKSGLVPNCKVCVKKYRSEDAQKHRARSLKWHHENKEKSVKSMLAYQSKRTKIDPEFKLRRNLRSRLNKALRQNSKIGSAISDLGCSISDFKKHLESKFKSGMSWDNYGRKGWTLDHIIPLSKFDLSDPEQFLKANNFNNFQPLWFWENSSKSNKLGI